MARRIYHLFAAAIMVALITAGCGSGGRSGSGISQSAADSAPATAPSQARPAEQADAAGNSSAQAGATVPQSERKIILNAEVHIKVDDVEQAIAALRQIATVSGGYVAGSQVSGQKQSGRQGTISMRIPAGNYESIMQQLPNLGEIRESRDWTEDVTDQFLDLQPRIAAKEQHLQQLMKLYDREATTEELMRLTTEIDRVQGELDAMKGRLQYLTNQVAFSTISVRLYEDGTTAPPPPPKNVWERSVRSFTSSVSGLIRFVGDMFVLGAGLLPQLVFWGVLATGGYGVVRVIRSRRQGPPAPPAS